MKRLNKKEIADKLGVRTDFTPTEVMELQEMQRLVNSRKFEAAQIKGNTALVPKGQEVADQLEAIARLLENVKNGWVSGKLAEHGYPKDAICNINLTNGKITLTVPINEKRND